MSPLILAFGMLTLSSSSCGPRRVVVNGREMTYEEGAKQIYEEGKKARSQGDAAGAKVRYKEIVDAFEDSAQAPEALADLADLLFEEGGCRAARTHLERLAEDHPTHPRAQRAKELLGRCDAETGGQGPLGALQGRYDRASTDVERKDIASTAADASIAAGEFGAAVRWLLRVLSLEEGDAEKSAIKTEITEIIDSRVSFQEVRELLEETSGNDFPKGLLTYKLGRIQYHVRDLTNAQETLKSYIANWPGGANETGAKALLALIQARSNVKPRTVGVVLPLSGKNRSYGENALQAIQLAIYGDDEEAYKKSAQALNLVVRDTKSEKAAAAQAVQELALDEGAIAIVGPMFTSEAQPAAWKAQELGVPLVTISAADDIATIGPYVFRNGLTNHAQAEALVRYAMDIAGMKTFAVLYPRHPYGEELLHLFWDEVEERQGEIRGVESYGTEDTTFASQVKSLVARDVVGLRSDYKRAIEECDKQPDNYRRDRCKERVSQDLRPIVDFDGLFIPDYPRTIALITAALAFEDIIVETEPKYLRKIEKTLGRKVTPVTLLGASGWNSPELPEKAQRNVENAVFTDAFFAGSDDKPTVEFVTAFQKKYKRTPAVVEALLYDSARIVKSVLEGAQPATREAARESLRRVHGFPGVTGKTSFVGGTDAEKEVRILTIKNGSIQEVVLPENKGATEESGDRGVPVQPGGTR